MAQKVCPPLFHLHPCKVAINKQEMEEQKRLQEEQLESTWLPLTTHRNSQHIPVPRDTVHGVTRCNELVGHDSPLLIALNGAADSWNVTQPDAIFASFARSFSLFSALLLIHFMIFYVREMMWHVQVLFDSVCWRWRYAEGHLKYLCTECST